MLRPQYIRFKNIYPIPPPYIIDPPGTRGIGFDSIKITKRYKFTPLRPPGARQPDAEGRIAMRLAAMVDGRYCCGDAIGR
jgi:hypothetical protein